jgi:hypothetical protein
MTHYLRDGETNVGAARRLWRDFGDIPLEGDSDTIDEKFLHFERGVCRFEIWHWFEDEFDVAVIDLMFGGSA